MSLDEKHLKDLINLIELIGLNERLSKEDVNKFIELESIDECKQYMEVMLDFYFDVFNPLSNRVEVSEFEQDRDLWLQTIFSKGCSFLRLLDGISYSKGLFRLNKIVDFPTLFTIARRIYESLIAFELLFVLPKTPDQQTIVYNLFVAHTLSERLRNLDEEFHKENPERIEEEKKDFAACKKNIEETKLYKTLNKHTKDVIQNAIGKKFRYLFKEDNTMEFIQYDKAHRLLNVKEGIFDAIYSHFSLHGHPSYLSLIQFRESYKPDSREDLHMAYFATKCMLSFMSIFIIDYMKLNPAAKEQYDKLEEPRRFAIGMYEYGMRGEKIFQ